MPRKSENDPRVTINGGSPSRVISRPLSAPPATPVAIAHSPASGSGIPRSRAAAPKTTAASPIIEPTDRSIPPLIRMGVSAIASSPSSTLSRSTSNKLPSEKKRSAISEKIAISTSRTASSVVSAVLRMPVSQPYRVDRHRHQDDESLHGTLPVRGDSEERERGAESAEQDDAQHGPCHRAAPAGNRGAADDNGGNHAHFETEAGIGRDLVEADRVQHRREPGQ